MFHGLVMMLFAALFGAGGRFDLICNVPDHEGQPAATPIHVRVDTAKGLYCLDDCQTGQRLATVSERAIVLFDGSDGGRHRLRITVLHNDAGQAVLHFYRGSHPDREGVCEIRPFSGIPDRGPPPPLE